MKKSLNYAALIVMTICCAAVTSCDNKLDVEGAPAPRDTTTTPTTPEKPNTPSFVWETCVRQDVAFNEATDSVTSTNTWQVTENGEAKFEDAVMRYKFGVEVSAPTRIVTTASDTTVYAGKGKDVKTYGDFVRTGNDSLRTVTTVVEGGFRTQYYTVSLTTNRMEGIDLRGGKWLAYKNVTETSQLTSLWHEPLKEVEQNDSVFNREVSHVVLTITLKSDRQTWTIQREKVVVVDHFVKMKEEEKPEPEKVKADDYLKGLARFISATKVYNPDKKLWGDAYLFEGSESYKIVICWYNKDDKPQGKSFYEINFGTCPKSNEYNAVAYIRGNFYPGLISHDGKTWAVGCYVNGSGESQLYDSNHVDLAGIKNFKDNNSAYPTPYIPNTPDVKTVNGVKVISVTGKTSVHTSKVTIADSSLK